ncbi:glycine/sarcosine/betaine reductase complex component C subunit beta [Mycoplasmatota bacterium WC44]
MAKAVIKDAGYSLFHTPEMLIHLGVTQVTERKTNPDSEYITNIRESLRTFEDVKNYLPNQVYIGNLHPNELTKHERPFCNIDNKDGSRYGTFGEIMPEKELLLYMMICDAFGLVMLEESFLLDAVNDYQEHPLKTEEEISKVSGKGSKIEDIKTSIENGSEPLYFSNNLVGCVKKAHELDPNLNSHVMTENLVVKATGAITLKHLLAKNSINAEDIGYVIECSEEACGDMNQRGGGNFAKAIAESVGAKNAGGCDIRAFCAAPTHTLIHAATLVESGVYDNVVVVAGGATAKLGMNGKDHVKKGYKILEDVLGGFAVLISKNDGVSPVIRTDVVGTHKVGTGSSPQVVTKSLVEEPLKRNGLKLSDVDKYSVEMQNPDLTSLAGAGDVPLANYKMIAALAVMNKEIERKDIMDFVETHGMVGWAPTQGHIPSGIPYCGHLITEMTTDTNINRAMIVGKGSLFLARMTNLFDGISVMVERNNGLQETSSVSKEEINKLIAKSLKEFASSLLSE